MSAVKDRHQAEVQALTARADAAKLALREAVESLVFDEPAVRAKSAALAAVMTDGAMTELRIRNEAFKVLTPDQQKKAAAIQKLQRELRELMKSGAPMNK
jgi:Spy/CpxP family protein refolding chaperone